MERINLRLTDDSRDVVHKAVAALAQGESVVFAADRFAGILSGLASPGYRSNNLADRESTPATLLVRGLAELVDWVPDLNAYQMRFVRRAWPSSLAILFPADKTPSFFAQLDPSAQAKLRQEDGIAIQVPDHAFIREVARLVPGPVAFSDLAWKTSSPEQARGFAIDKVLENLQPVLSIEDLRDGVNPRRTTLVRITENHWKMIREGYVTPTMLDRISGTIILFVCTGNTCRSPMAEALCKILMARRLGCDIGQLESRGYYVLSAGVAATPGMPAASNAVNVAEARGGSLRNHASRPVTGDLVYNADHILAMTSDHLDVLLDRAPEVADRARLLHPEGEDVPDPVGMDLDVYQRTANAIESYLNPWLDSIGL